MPLHVSSTYAHHQEVKITLHSLWYHHTEVKIALHSLWYHHIYRCDDTRGCVMQFWPPDDEHMCSKHVEAWNKLIVKEKLCASNWLITEINILRCRSTKRKKILYRGPYTMWNFYTNWTTATFYVPCRQLIKYFMNM